MHPPTLTLRSRRALLSALAATAALLTIAAPRAAADQPVSSGRQACHYDGLTYYACHILKPSTSFFYDDDFATLHVNMTQQEALKVIACPGGVTASLWGNDGGDGMDSDDDFIRNLTPDPGNPVYDGWSGLDAHFTTRFLSGTNLDEDDGSDEVYVRFAVKDCNNGALRLFQSDDLVGEMWNGRT